METTLRVDMTDIRRLKSAMDTYQKTLARRLPLGEPFPKGVYDLITRLDEAENDIIGQLDVHQREGNASVPV